MRLCGLCCRQTFEPDWDGKRSDKTDCFLESGLTQNGRVGTWRQRGGDNYDCCSQSLPQSLFWQTFPPTTDWLFPDSVKNTAQAQPLLLPPFHHLGAAARRHWGIQGTKWGWTTHNPQPWAHLFPSNTQISTTVYISTPIPNSLQRFCYINILLTAPPPEISCLSRELLSCWGGGI